LLTGGLPAWFMPLENRLQKFANALQISFIAFRPLTSLSYKSLWLLGKGWLRPEALNNSLIPAGKRWPGGAGMALLL
jgi:hypothetical protein